MTCLCRGTRLIVSPELLAWALAGTAAPAPAVPSHEPCPRCGDVTLAQALGPEDAGRLAQAARCAGETPSALAARLVRQALAAGCAA